MGSGGGDGDGGEDNPLMVKARKLDQQARTVESAMDVSGVGWGGVGWAGVWYYIGEQSGLVYATTCGLIYVGWAGICYYVWAIICRVG